MSQALATLSEASRLLAAVETVDAAKDVRDKAEALRLYAKQAGMGLDMQNRCAELKLRAERKAGELLANMPLKINQHVAGDTLSQAGVERHQSSRWQRVASIPEGEFEALVSEAFRESKELTTSSALKLAKRLAAVTDTESELRTPGLGHHAEAEPTEFTTIVIDPPWRYDNVATRGAAEDHYGTMSQAELLAMVLPAAPDAHLYLWVTNSFIDDGFDLMRAWGFTYKTCLTWCKPQMGMGNYFRSTTEHVLFGVKGRLPTLANNVPTHFVADRTRHSAKPESFYDLVEKSSPGPYIEFFARRQRFGWAAFGDQFGDAA